MADKLRERSRTFVLEVFANYTVTVVTSNNIHESACKRGIHPDQNWEALHCGATGGLFSYIFLPENARLEVVAHESFHCVWHIMKCLGADFENEIMAYTLSFVVAEILAFLKNDKRPKHKITPKRGPLSKTLLHGATNNCCNYSCDLR